MSFTTIGLIGIALLFILIFLRVPVGFAMAAVGFVGFWMHRFFSGVHEHDGERCFFPSSDPTV